MSSENSFDYLELATDGVKGLHPYQPGKPVSELERELGLSDIVKLASNENPLGPSPKALAAISSEFDELTRYPDGNGFALKDALANKLVVNTDQITLGNGSNDCLDLIARAYAGEGREVIYSQYAFAVYAISTQSVGAKAVVVPAKDWGHDLQAMSDAVTGSTSLIFVANPNNPTGTWLPLSEIKQFLDSVPQRVIVVLDEAYFEYLDDQEYPDGMALLADYPNLIVTRTFSKAWGLASLRIGYAVSSAKIADVINRVRQPFNGNSFALAAACAALNDQEYLEASVNLNNEGLAQVEKGLSDLGLSYIPSVGNFITFELNGNAMPVYQALLAEGVIVRPVANYGMPNHLRVSIGLVDENQRFLDALKKVLG